MRLLFIHSDHLEFEVTEQAGPDGLAGTEGVPMEGAMEECATVFISVNGSGQDDDIELSIDDLAVAVLDDIGDKPAKPWYLPRYISDRPDFK